MRGEVVRVERIVSTDWLEVSLGERLGLVPTEYLEFLDDSVEEEEAGTPSTPDKPG